MDPAQCIPDAGPLDADASPPPSDAGPDGGDGGDAGSTDAGSADAGRTADAAEDDSENAVDAQDLYGCSCRVGGTTARPKGLLLLLVAAAAFGLRRRKRRLFRGTLVALALGALLGAGGVAAAQAVDKAKLDEARRHYEQGQTQYDLGNFDAAIDAYKKAYELSNQPGLLFNIAQAYRLKKDYEKALYFYKSYLRRLPDAQNRADVEARIADMEQQIAANEAAAKAPPTGTIQPTGPSGGGSDAGSGGGARGPGGGGGTTGPGAGSGSSPSGPGSGSIASGSGGGDVADSSVVGEVDTLARARRRWSVGLRADVAPSAPGALLVLGLGLELNERLELDAGAAVGGSYGAWVGATYRLGRGALRPLARVGVPILIEDGTQIGAQGMVGLEIGLGPRLAVRLEGGGAVFPTVDGSAAVALVGVGLASRL
jgi:MYXO-CTERM domain-containing protein